MKDNKIIYWNRKQKTINTEKVLDNKILLFLYKNFFGRFLTNLFFSKRIFSFIYALFYESKRSRKKIRPFIKDFNIKKEDFKPYQYNSFNDFFIRRFKPGVRSFVKQPSAMPAFSEGRYLAWKSISPEQTFPVKGSFLTSRALLDSNKKAKAFLNGPVIIARLAPQDYHRFHFIDSGRIVDHYKIKGNLNSVNPLALSSKGNILCTNKREVTIQKTDNFGLIAYIEIGAMTIGKIVQYCNPGDTPNRGDEKGYFKYGSSTVVLFGERGSWIPDREILEYTKKGIETFVELGTAIAFKK